MKPKMMLKMGLDLVMTVLLLCQMAYMLIGEAAHEWMGAAMFVLFLLHHVLNWRWYRNLVKGKYTALPILQTVVDFLIGRVSPSRVRTWIVRLFALAVSGFGIYTFLKNNIADYLFVRSQFVFFDMEQPLYLFFAEYLAMMGLWACIAYYAARLIQKGAGRRIGKTTDSRR